MEEFEEIRFLDRLRYVERKMEIKIKRYPFVD